MTMPLPRLDGGPASAPPRLPAREEWFRAVFDGSAMPLAVVSMDGRFIDANSAFEAVVGRSGDDLYGEPLGTLDHPDDREQNALLFRRVLSGELPSHQMELRHVGGDGVVYPARLTLSVVRGVDGEARFCVAMLDDLRQRTAPEPERDLLEGRLRHLALHDPLTGLPNRVLLAERMHEVLATLGDEPGARCGVLFLDLDRFKNVNDSLGHNVGDELLRQVAVRLAACARPGDTVARFGGDEFIFFLPRITGREEALALAADVRVALSAPLELGNYRTYTTASIGIALADKPADSADEMLRNADIAMYYAKAGGGTRCAVFDGSMHRAAMARLGLETDLRGAIAREELKVYFQPIVSLATGNVVAAEALSRWSHPVHGRVPPDKFISLAEDTGLIGALGTWVLDEATRQLAEWRATVPQASALEISVNVSPWQLRDGELVETVAATLGEHGVPAAALKLELTESTLVEDAARAAGILRALKKRDVQIYLDDFGTGYSSLSLLHRLPLDALKIDRSFVGGMDGGSTGAVKGAEIVRTILALARSLGVRVVAEGVETHEQLAALRALGCDYAQGYLISPPVPAEEFEAAFLLAQPPYAWQAGHHFG
ncbi:MAG TPA: EAL domain-containing protein [Longimicrobium sp.]|jgi:Amt family ammonium transporter|uniref:putative bifunctional diguanylate cyclase/phosphodiesterase n=1 Tax=Longimicrobium sp. TaxID=2029185 RepID=UPI002ED8E57D